AYTTGRRARVRQLGALLLLLLLVACDLQLPGQDGDRLQVDLNESVVAAFITARTQPGLPAGPLEYRAGSIYSTAPAPGAEGGRAPVTRGAAPGRTAPRAYQIAR